MGSKDISKVRLLLLLLRLLLSILFTRFSAFVSILVCLASESILLQIFLVWIWEGGLPTEGKLLTRHVVSLVMRLCHGLRRTTVSRVSSGCSTTQLASRGCCIGWSLILVTRTLIKTLIHRTWGGLRKLILCLEWHKVRMSECCCSVVVIVELLLIWNVMSGLRSWCLLRRNVWVIHIVKHMRKYRLRMIQGRLAFIHMRGMVLNLTILSLQLVHGIQRIRLLMRRINVAYTWINSLSTAELLEATLICRSGSCHEIYLHVLLLCRICTSVVVFVHI